MKGKLILLTAVFVIFVLVLGGIKVLNNRSPKQGVLKVNSIPTVSVFLDNKHLGRTPVEEKVDAGDFAHPECYEHELEEFA